MIVCVCVCSCQVADTAITQTALWWEGRDCRGVQLAFYGIATTLLTACLSLFAVPLVRFLPSDITVYKWSEPTPHLPVWCVPGPLSVFSHLCQILISCSLSTIVSICLSSQSFPPLVLPFLPLIVCFHLLLISALPHLQSSLSFTARHRGALQCTVECLMNMCFTSLCHPSLSFTSSTHLCPSFFLPSSLPPSRLIYLSSGILPPLFCFIYYPGTIQLVAQNKGCPGGTRGKKEENIRENQKPLF